jgi:protein-tyrosine phosphatase
VYVHCRAGHGRSAAAVFGWLIYKDPIVDLKTLNSDFRKLRNIRSTLWKQSNLQQLHKRLKETGTLLTVDESSEVAPPKLTDDSSSDEDL